MGRKAPLVIGVLLALALAALAEGAEEPAPDFAGLSFGPDAASVERAWLAGGALEERVARTRDAALAIGMWDVDPAARALLLEESLGSPLERARLAAELAPGLPDAHAALAAAELRYGLDPIASAASLRTAVAAVASGESAAWWRAAWWAVLQTALCWGGLGFLLVAGLLKLPFAVRQLVGALPILPMPSALAVFAALLLAPAALGEGVVGIAFVSSAFAFCYGRLPLRVCSLVAAGLVVLAIHPVADRSAEALARLGTSPLVEAASQLDGGIPRALDARRLEREPDRSGDALALLARRHGKLALADQRYDALLASELPPSAARYNNAANTKLALGETEEAIGLYEEGVRAGPSPWILFNLSQAYGRRILLEEQDFALADAQALDSSVVLAITDRVGASEGNGVVDLPSALSPGDVPDPGGVAAAFRARYAPGWLGSTPIPSLLVLAAVASLGLLAASRVDVSAERGDLYAGIARLAEGREATDPTLRMERLAALRARQHRAARAQTFIALLIPAAAGVLYGRPVLGLLGALSGSAALAFAMGRGGVVPDPLVAGASAALILTGAAALCALLYAGQLALCFLLRESA